MNLPIKQALLGLCCMFFSLSIHAQSNHTITIDGTDDFTGVEDFTGTSSSTWSFTWDATNFYFGLEASDVNSGNANIFAYLYIDTDPQRSPLTGNGSSTGVSYNTQTPGLPFNADYHVRWKADNTYLNMLDYNNGTGSWTDDNTAHLNFSISAFQNGNYLEIAIPRSSLGNPSSVYIAGGMLNETSMAESTFFMIPASGNSDGYDADHNSFYGFDLSSGITPNSSGVLNSYPTASNTAAGNFNTAGSWTNGIPTSTDNAIIKNGHNITLDATATVEALTIESGGTFTGSDGSARTLNIASGGSITNRGTLTPTTNGTVDFNGTGELNGSTTDFFNLTTQGGDVTLNTIANVSGLINISGTGNLVSSGNLIINSDATSTGMVAINNIAGSITGDVTIERHLTNQANDFFFSGYSAVAAGYHYISYPISDGTINELSDDLSLVITNPYSTASGGNGATTTPFPNLFKYNETLVTAGQSNIIAWDTPTNLTESVSAGQGFVLQHNNNNVIDMTGTLNNTTIADGLTVNLTRTLATGSESGWNLIGNPYPAPIQWTSVSRSNVEATIYMQIATSQYNGVWMSTNGTVCTNCDNTDANRIPMMQGFFVRVSSGNTTGSVSFDNNDRITSYENPAFYRTSQGIDLDGLVKLKIKNETSNKSDETIIAFSPEFTNKFDVDFDGLKAFDNAAGWPAIYSRLENDEHMAINGLGFSRDENTTVPLSIKIEEDGKQSINVHTLSHFDVLTAIYLEDRYTNQLIDLTSQDHYVFEAEKGLYDDRFSLHFRSNRVTALEDDWNESGLTVWGNNNQIHLKFEDIEAAKSSISLFDISGKALFQTSNASQLEVSLQPQIHQQIVLIRIENTKGVFVKKLYLH